MIKKYYCKNLSNSSLYILHKILLCVILVFFVFSFEQCSEKKQSKKQIPNNNSLVQVNYDFNNPPAFRKDSYLTFIKKQSFDKILKIDVEIASTDEERARGLMYRKSLETNQGMLFLFANETTQSFYMRNTIIPLDIIYVNSKNEIVDIYHNTKTLDETSLPSKAPAKYVVEVNAGLCKQFNIQEGDFVEF